MNAALRSSRTVAPQRRILASVREYLCEHSQHPVYVEDLCEALQVSPARLTDAYLSRLGVTPQGFLRLRRLRMVRAALRARGAVAASVKSVAVAHGFWDPRRFYADYRAAFGEWPFETVLCGRGWSLVGPRLGGSHGELVARRQDPLTVPTERAETATGLPTSRHVQRV